MIIEPGRPIILFDGVCGLCDRFVQFAIRNDPEGKVLFAPLQSEKGKELLQKFGFQENELSFIVLIDGDKSYVKSAAILRVLHYFQGFVRHFVFLSVIPPLISDAVYDVVARHRYNWFGKYEECKLPTPEERKRFLA